MKIKELKGNKLIGLYLGAKYCEANAIDVTTFNIDGAQYGLKNNVNNLLISICQLAEEVEEKYELQITELSNILSSNSLIINQLYTKKQVEELLQKQRELCAIEGRTYYDENKECWLIKTNSIINAKLKID